MGVGVFLQSYGFYGDGNFGTLLSQWEQAGVFSYMLPFLIIFALIFGILTKINLFGTENNKSINAIIALSVSLMALQFGFVSVFFSEVFPRLGIALAGLLVVIILLGLTGHSKNKTLYSMILWGSVVAIVVILVQSFDIFDPSYGNNILGFIPVSWIPWIVLIGGIAIVAASSGKSTTTPGGHLLKAFGGDSS